MQSSTRRIWSLSSLPMYFLTLRLSMVLIGVLLFSHKKNKLPFGTVRAVCLILLAAFLTDCVLSALFRTPITY